MYIVWFTPPSIENKPLWTDTLIKALHFRFYDQTCKSNTYFLNAEWSCLNPNKWAAELSADTFTRVPWSCVTSSFISNGTPESYHRYWSYRQKDTCIFTDDTHSCFGCTLTFSSLLRSVINASTALQFLHSQLQLVGCYGGQTKDSYQDSQD